MPHILQSKCPAIKSKTTKSKGHQINSFSYPDDIIKSQKIKSKALIILYKVIRLA